MSIRRHLSVTNNLRAARSMPQSGRKLLNPRLPLSLCLFGYLLSFASPTSALAYVSPTTATDYPGAIVRPFDKPVENWLSGHRGVDLKAQVGEIIYSAGDGTVAFAGKVAGTPVVSIDHEPGKRTTYQPVHAFVRKGDDVTEGQPIGYLAPSTDGHPGLHWGLLTGKDEYENPLSLLEYPVIRLKPVGEHF